MSIGTTAALIGGGIAAAGAITSGVIGSEAATSAADTQAQASEYAANLENQQFEQTQANEAPFIQAGQQTIGQMVAGLQPGGQFNTPNPAGTFTTPTLAQAQQQPGYQFAQQQGDLGIEQGAAAAGGAFTTGTLKSLAGYNNQLAQTSYQNTYQNALNTYLTQFNAANTQQTNLYNRLAGVSDAGQTATTQLGQIGQQTAATVGNTLTGGAAATAAGTIGSANAITNAITGISNNASGYLTLSQILGNQNPNSGGTQTGLTTQQMQQLPNLTGPPDTPPAQEPGIDF